MTAPLTPAEYRALRIERARLEALLEREYVAAYNTAYERQVVESVPTRGHHVPDNDPESLAKQAEQVTRDHAKLRGQLKGASGFARRMTEGLENHRHWILEAFEKDERRHGGEFDPVKFPPSAEIADVRDAAEAQRRRLERGEPLTGDDAETRDRLGERQLDEVLSSARKGNRR